jgi:succinate dehydrogenase/fumarate reductase cytochrome b subunit
MVRKLHFAAGLVLALFVFSHLAVHLTALGGASTHLSVLTFVQKAYRNPVVEPLLLAILLLQVGLGVRLAIANWKKRSADPWRRMQILSGIYLGWFIIVHAGAALYTRYGFGLDTNFYWASGTLIHPITRWIFYPYYTLAILAVFGHAAAAMRRRFSKAGAGRTMLATGAAVTLLIMLAFGGWLFPVTMPDAYRAYYDTLLAKVGL